MEIPRNISYKYGHNKGQKESGPKKNKRLRRGGSNTQKNCSKKVLMTRIITKVSSLTHGQESSSVKSSGA